jgi:hypothetical protein
LHANPQRQYCHSTDPHDALAADIAALQARIDAGERRIAEALAPEPVDIEKWQQFWIDLLADYERLYRRLGDTPLRGGA